jgi:hypothetical protein
MSELCWCGRPLHYRDQGVRRSVETMIKRMGPNVVVTTAAGSFLVPRHYIALHGLKAEDVPTFPRAE